MWVQLCLQQHVWWASWATPCLASELKLCLPWHVGLLLRELTLSALLSHLVHHIKVQVHGTPGHSSQLPASYLSHMVALSNQILHRFARLMQAFQIVRSNMIATTTSYAHWFAVLGSSMLDRKEIQRQVYAGRGGLPMEALDRPMAAWPLKGVYFWGGGGGGDMLARHTC